MTALYAILAIICIGGILMGAYLIGFDDGVKAEQMRRRLYIYSKGNLPPAFKTDENGYIGSVETDNDRHAITHADLAQMEQETINKQKEQ